MDLSSEAAIRRVPGRLIACVEARAGCTEWEVETEAGRARAVAYPALAGPLRPGDRVWLNTTAAALALGTGGVHFVIAPCGEGPSGAGFPGREAGHILKLRYTPLQMRVLAAEEEASPHRGAVEAFRDLGGAPVLTAELHSQAGAAILAAHAAAPQLRIVLVQTDSAALPLAFSRLVPRLRDAGALAASVTAGQAFGGDYEAINLHSALAVARAAAGAELIVVTQGPGNAGTGTELGFSGLALAEALHAAAALGGLPILAPRMSDADPRPRHRGVSRHTLALLRCLLAPVIVPHPPLPDAARARLPVHTGPHRWVETDPEPVLPALQPFRDVLTTMGRTVDEDPLFFRAAAAAGRFAALQARPREKRT